MIRARLVAAGVATSVLIILVPRGFETVFLLSAFLLRLMDRRWAVRQGWRGWTSHIRLKPARLLIWIAATMAGGFPALCAAALGELLLYPVMTRPLANIQRSGLVALMILMGAMLEGLTRIGLGFDLLRCLSLYASGMMLGVFWLRGPDGEPGAALIASGGVLLFGAIGLMLPASLSWSLSATYACLLLLLAHLTTLRRTAQHWRWHDASSFSRAVRIPRFRPASPPT